MSRISAPIPLPPKPGIVSLCELVIAAGMAGLSIAVHFQDFPAHLLCKLWQYCMNFAGPIEVRQVRNQSDIRKLPEACGGVKLVLVHAEKLRSATAWAIEMASLADTEANSRPAIFCASSPGSDGDDPGTALTIRANPVEVAALARWFAFGQIPTVPNWQAIGEDLDVNPAPALVPVLGNEDTDEPGTRHLRERDLLRSLIVGAAVLRSLCQQADGTPEIADLPLTVEDYEQVRRLLQSPSITPADETCDPLAKDMVSRANVFLQARYAEPNAQDNPFNVDAADSPPGKGVSRYGRRPLRTSLHPSCSAAENRPDGCVTRRGHNGP